MVSSPVGAGDGVDTIDVELITLPLLREHTAGRLMNAPRFLITGKKKLIDWTSRSSKLMPITKDYGLQQRMKPPSLSSRRFLKCHFNSATRTKQSF